MLVALTMSLALIVLAAIWVWDVERERRRRAMLFADAMVLFESCRVTQDGMHFPVLEGRYRQQRIKLEPVVDDLGVRKIPSLWLKATVLADNPDRGVLDYLVRPQGIEVYSPSSELPTRLPIPDAWPQHAILCTDRPTGAPPVDLLTPHVAAFADQRLKELLITNRGVRLVYQSAQAERGAYLVLRQARFATDRLDPALVGALLDKAIAIMTCLDHHAMHSAADAA
jgi:hypothetical protein